MEEHGDLSQETLCLPGTGSDEECPGLAGGSSAVKSENGTPPDDGDDGHEPIGGNPAEPAKINKSETRNVSLHSVYWAVVHENQKFLKKKYPNKSRREILAMAKKECFVSKGIESSCSFVCLIFFSQSQLGYVLCHM